MVYRKLLLIVIILLATFLRFNQLNNLPALNADEAAIGYNAYSLIKTGNDEHGNPWPIHFQSFNDYKPGLFFYIVLPFVWILGLNEWAVRIPGAILGVVTVWLIYLLVVELLKATGPVARSSQPTSSSVFVGLAGARWDPLRSRHPLPYLSAFLLAISPWHIHFSRGGWEVNAGTFFIVAGVWLFIKSIRNPKFYILSFIFFIFSLYTYHSARVIVPFLLIGLLWFYRRELWVSKTKILLPVLVAGLIIVPLIIDLFGPAGFSRASGVSIFADQGVIERINEQRGEHGDLRTLPALLPHNKLVNYSLEFLENWGKHFWGEFLFLSGDEIQRNKVPEIGQLYLFQLPLLIIGLLAIARNSGWSANWRIVLWWLIIAPTAAALTFQSPHALRAHNMVIPLTIISAYGMFGLLAWLRSSIKPKSLLVTCYLLLVTFLVWDFTRYLHQYYFHMAKEYPFSSQYGVKELVGYVKENYDKYPSFVITDRYDQPYILFLFYLRVYDQTSSAYLQYPPEKFQKEHTLTSRDKFGFSTVRDFDKFHFRQITKDVLEESRGSLVVGSDKEIEDAANIINIIKFPNNEPAFKIVAN